VGEVLLEREENVKSIRTKSATRSAAGFRSKAIRDAVASFQLQPLEPRQLMAATLPAGFEETTFIEGLNGATSMELAPDGRIFISEKFGDIKIVKNGQLLNTPALTIDVDTFRDRGISGIELDPNFSSNGHIYVHYTKAVPNNRDKANNGAVNRVSRFTVVGDSINSNTELVLVDGVASSSGFHPGGFMDFGNDGKLYIGFGTPDVSDGSQNLNNYIGKILRINPDGSAPSDNPFVGQANARGAIWAYGFRNPFSGAVDPVTGKIYVNDVGENTWEEINEVQKGKNYGWPNAEGNSSNPAYTNPIYAYGHMAQFGGEAAITGGVFYRGNNFPSQYNGDYFFGDYDTGYLQVRDSATGQVTIFGQNLFRPVDLDMSADGNLYYLSVWGGTIQKISYVGTANRAPNAVATANPTAGTRPLLVSFSGDGSFDPDGDSLVYTWDFGDGTTAVGKNLEHTYNQNGQFTAKLTVSDGNGGSDVVNDIIITVGNEQPVATITSPNATTKYRGGTTINFSGTGVDEEDGILAANKFSWKVEFYHGNHAQNSETYNGIKNGSFDIPSLSLNAADQFIRIHLTVTDSIGLQRTTYVDIHPQLTNLTLAANIPGLELKVDGQPKTSPYTFASVAGNVRLIGAPTQQTLNGKLYEFVSWSDGGAASHEVTTPNSAATYTAIYREVNGKTLPGTIQIEDFDNGANNVAYRDLDTANQGGAYRNTGVDIQATTDEGGGYNVGWAKAGEWLQYTVNVETAGTYSVDFRVASKAAGGTFHLNVDGVNVTGTMQVPTTGAHQTFTTITKSGVNLTAGTHVLRLMIDSHNATTGIAGNFNWMRFNLTTATPNNQAPVTAITSPNNNQEFNEGEDVVIVASAFDPDGTIAKVEFYVDGKLVGTDSAGIFDVTVEGLKVATHVAYVVAYDNLGKTTTSSPISINITSEIDLPPVVAITSHTNGQTLNAGTTQVIVANASDPDGTITKVEFYVDNVLIGTDNGGDFDNDWLNIPSGQHVLTAKAYSNDGAVTTSAPITVNVVVPQGGQSPFSGTPITATGLIQAEDFDNGAQGVAYSDSDTTNYNSPYRNTRVDIEANTDTGGGYSVGHVKAGEWLEYTINIATAGVYDFQARASSKAAGGTFHMELNGVNMTNGMTVPNTGAWATYQTVTRTGLNLAAGTYVMRIAMDTNGPTTGYVGNFNWFRFVKQ
jgi:glucose/arabinose dehydrogenase